MGGKHKEDIEEKAINTKYEMDQNAQLQAFVAGIAAKSGKMQPQAWFHWDPYRVKSDYTNNNIPYESVEKLRGNRYYSGARLIYALSDSITVVPAITWEHVGGHVTIDADPSSTISLGGLTYNVNDLGQQYKVDTVNAGVNMQYATGGFFGLLITGSAGLQWSRFVRELDIDHTDFSDITKAKSFAAPVVGLGLEYWANKTLCLRGGLSTTTLLAVSKAKAENKDASGVKRADISSVETVQSTKAAVGMGLHFGNLLIDMVFGNMFLTGEDGWGDGQGPNLYSNLDVKVKW
jgi:hypothetical protein